LKTRSYEKEIMDEFELGGEAMSQTLRELKFINYWLGGNAVTINGLEILISDGKKPQAAMSIADLGCGGGDMLMLTADWMRKKRLDAQLFGVDANEFITQYARQHSAEYPEISYQNLNVFSLGFQSQAYDIVTCTLFCHHFTDEELIALFRSLHRQVRTGIVINDLHRHWLAYHLIKWLTRWFSKSYLVKNDAKLSVRRGFRRHDWENIFRQAGISNVRIRWRWAFRWQVIVFK